MVSPDTAAPTGAPVNFGRSRRRGALVQLARLAAALVFLLLWELATSRGWVDPLFVSTPGAVWEFLSSAVQTSEFWTNVRVTLSETLIGFAVGSVAGILTGLLFARAEWLYTLLDPFFTFLNSLPRVALAPLFILWFGIGSFSKVMLAISLVYFILTTSTRAGVKSVDPDIVTAARLLGAGHIDLLRKVILPGAVPAVFAGLRLAAVYSLLAVVAGEMVAAQAGLGQQLTFYSGTFNTAGVLSLLFVLGLIGTGLNSLMAAGEHHLLRWQEKG